MKLYILTSGSDKCIEGVFTSLEKLNEFKEKYPNKIFDPDDRFYSESREGYYAHFKYNDPIILESDNFPDFNEKNIIEVLVLDDWGTTVYKTRKVENDKKNRDRIDKMIKIDGIERVYVYANNRKEAIKKSINIFKENGFKWWD